MPINIEEGQFASIAGRQKEFRYPYIDSCMTVTLVWKDDFMAGIHCVLNHNVNKRQMDWKNLFHLLEAAKQRREGGKLLIIGDVNEGWAKKIGSPVFSAIALKLNWGDTEPEHFYTEQVNKKDVIVNINGESRTAP